MFIYYTIKIKNQKYIIQNNNRYINIIHTICTDIRQINISNYNIIKSSNHIFLMFND